MCLGLKLSKSTNVNLSTDINKFTDINLAIKTMDENSTEIEKIPVHNPYSGFLEDGIWGGEAYTQGG